MGLFGKPKNRAFERRRVLDVKIARRKVVRQRVRVASLAAGLSLATVFAIYVLWRAGDWALTRFIYENKAFAVQEIDVQTDGVISTDQLRRWAGVKLEQNLFAIDLTRVKRDIELVPAVQTVAVVGKPRDRAGARPCPLLGDRLKRPMRHALAPIAGSH